MLLLYNRPYPILSNAIGGIKLCVNDSQLEAGNTLINQFEAENWQAQKCPNCNFFHVQYIVQPGKTSNWLLAIVSWLSDNYAISGKQVYHCYDCGYEFVEIKATDLNNN